MTKKYNIIILIGFMLITIGQPDCFADTQGFTVLNEGVDYLDKLIDNKVFVKRIVDVEYEDGFLYLLDAKLCIVFKVDYKSGKLADTYFSRGQGPSELMMPVSFAINEGKIFVLDKGFNGVKWCGPSRKDSKEFKISGVIGDKTIDITKKNEIYVTEYDSQKKTYVAIYDLQGNKKRSIVTIETQNQKKRLMMNYCKIRIDGDGNIYLLFRYMKELNKFDANGRFLWKYTIDNPLIEEYSEFEMFSRDKNGIVRARSCIFNFDLIEKNKIIIGHCSGGTVINTNGQTQQLITFEPKYNIDVFKKVGDELINILARGKVIKIYKLKENLL